MHPPLAVLLWQTGGTTDGSTAAVGPDLVGYLLSCALVLVVVLAAAWAFRRFVAGALRAKAAQRSLQVVDVLPLGGRQRLVVVRCYDRTFLLGQGEKEVRAIGELDTEAVPEAVPVPGAAPVAQAAPTSALPAPAAGHRAATSFARLLGRASATAPGAPPAVEVPQPAGVQADPTPDTPPRRPVLDGGKGILG